MNIRKVTVLASLLLFGAAGCQDLDVTNPNAADRERALRTAQDVESLIGGSFFQWWQSQIHINGPSPLLSVMSSQHSAYPANFGMVFYSAFPRVPFVNDPADQFYSNINNAWVWNYRALASAADGLSSIAAGDINLGEAGNRRAQAWGKFVQGLAHGSLAVMFDKGFVMDETIQTTDAAGLPVFRSDTVSYMGLMNAALGYFDEVIRLSEGVAASEATTIPAAWAMVAIPPARLAQLAATYKAEFRAAVSRTPQERAAVDWQAVLTDLQRGITADWEVRFTSQNWQALNAVQRYGTFFGWGQLDYQILGMADQSGRYQAWLNLPVGQRHPTLPAAAGELAGPFIIVTPDLRFPQGTTLAAQQANDGTAFEIPAVPGDQWGQAGRGTWRWSYYRWYALEEWHDSFATTGEFVWLPNMSVRMLEAEAQFRAGNSARAAELVNMSRTRPEVGLSATNATGANASCVPRLPNGQCGGLLEMIKWERRLNSKFTTLYSAPWYFDSRGWGDLPEGTILQFPMPAREAQILGLPVRTYGGVGGDFGAPRGTYGLGG